MFIKRYGTAWLTIAAVALPIAAHAQVSLIPGSATGQIRFGTQDVNGNATGNPVFSNEVVFGGNNYGYLISPRGPVANGGFADRQAALTDVVAPTNGNLTLTKNSGVNGQFGGGSLRAFANNNGAWFDQASLQDVANDLTGGGPYTASVVTVFEEADFSVGAFGFQGTIGSFFSIGGQMPNPQANAFLAASLVTIIDVDSPVAGFDQSFYSRTWLGYKSGTNGFIHADGVNSPYSNGNPALSQPNVATQMLFGTFGANSFSSAAAVTTLATFQAGTQFTVRNYLTMISNIGLGPDPVVGFRALNPGEAPPGINPPNFGANGIGAPEPGTFAFLTLGIVGFVVRRKK